MIVLDSDVLIEILDKKSRLGEEALQRVIGSGERPTTTAINLHEVLYGLGERSASMKDLAQLSTIDFTRRTLNFRQESSSRWRREGRRFPELIP